MDLIDSASTSKVFPSTLKIGASEMRRIIHCVMQKTRAALRGAPKHINSPVLPTGRTPRVVKKQRRIARKRQGIDKIHGRVVTQETDTNFERSMLPAVQSIQSGSLRSACFDPYDFRGTSPSPRRHTRKKG